MEKLNFPDGKKFNELPPTGAHMSMTEYHEWILYMANHFFTIKELRQLQRDSKLRANRVPFRLKDPIERRIK